MLISPLTNKQTNKTRKDELLKWMVQSRSKYVLCFLDGVRILMCSKSSSILYLLFQKRSSFWRLCFTLVGINHARLLASYSADALGISPVSAAYVSSPLWTPPAEVWRFQSLLIALPLASHVVLFGMRFLLLNRIIPASSFLPCSFSTHKWFSEISNCISLAMSFS